jgi:hypothetical protein
MTAKGMLSAAYRAGIVPAHLYGKAQHKTLQARLSEDILASRNDSKFFRTNPGVFFLSSLLPDDAIPNKYKQPFTARRRTRDLRRFPALAFDYDYFKSVTRSALLSWSTLTRDAEANNALRYVDSKLPNEKFAFVWAFSLVRRSRCALSYRIGRYRDDRDHFTNKRTIGFPALVNAEYQTLFSPGDYGISECALAAVLTDLDLSPNAFAELASLNMPRASRAVLVDDRGSAPVVLVVMEWNCPTWFEPTTRRLSLNDPRWLDVSVAPNNIYDFDRWSIATLEALKYGESEKTRGRENNRGAKGRLPKIRD